MLELRMPALTGKLVSRITRVELSNNTRRATEVHRIERIHNKFTICHLLKANPQRLIRTRTLSTCMTCLAMGLYVLTAASK